ncbi:cytochrome c maturation protein CcmE [Phytoactinopolyspora halotolerans]|uniref:Cytochrome c maturation protein CcmE n=1 Tax=Phytoactinopolyspora halotolerans TaxID=1981512 RepID=A0A6L9SA84_9ACTN|nr:cytochrome c maturation protein CcmE [Phytoactinopolyspora halotolerans]NEE02019.1 cytochrome c maturation protein CcmE [Phytoactinopolyspora halotolerans]
MSRRTRRTSAIAVLGVVVVALAVLGARFADESTVYYRTPSEIAGVEPGDERMRLSGLVVDGSVDRSDYASSLLLTDGAVDVTVEYEGRLPASIQPGEGAVVEGRLAGDGVFHADTVLLRHSNEYRPAESES